MKTVNIGNYTASITKVQDAQAMGEYKPTSIDTRKANADILIKYANGGSFTVASKIPLNGRGIKQPYSSKDMYEVTTNALDRLRKKYNVVTDF